MTASFRRIAWCMVAALAAASLSSAETAKPAVRVLDRDTFRSWTNAQRLALVEFYTPWCSYCQALAPAYEMAAATLQKDNIPLAKLDCDAYKPICKDMGIRGYPTLKVVRNGSFSMYNSTRQESAIVNYMLKHSHSAVSEVSTKEFPAFIKSKHVVVMGFFDSKSPALAVLESVASEFRDEFNFGYTTNAMTAKKLGLTAPRIVIYKDFDERWDAHTGEMTADEVRKFVKTRSTPLLGEMSSETFHAYSRAGFPIGLLFFNGQESRKELEASILPVAKEFRGVVSFALVDASMYKRHASMFHLEHKWPAFAIQDISAQTKYPMDQSKQLTAEQVRSFVDAFTHGKLSPSYKSDPTPEHNDGNVYELVSKEFEHVAFDTAKDVLIEFYSPSCIYCRQLEPVYEELGRLLGHNSRLVIARMNGATNDVPSNDQALNFPGYPTIVMIRADDNEIITYEGDRSLESLVSFVKEHSARRVLHDNDEKPQGRQVYMPAHKVDAGLTPKERRHDEL